MPHVSDEIDASLGLTVDEIAGLAEVSEKPAETLMNVVALIASRFRTDVCSAYLLEPDRSNLVLAATLGLQPKCIGTLRMPIRKGLVRPGGGAGAACRCWRRETIRASGTFPSPAKRSTTRSSGFR